MTISAREFDDLLADLRPKLHRYCARMVGSTVDGEDIVQDAALKAIAAWPTVGPADSPEGWLFRIAHNTALDFLRRRQRLPEHKSEDALIMIAAPEVPDADVAAASLRTFLRLPALQRSAVILKDVLGHSLEEVAAITGTSVPAAKSALQRGRVRLRGFATEAEDTMLPMLSSGMRDRLVAYVEGFRTGDFDGVRAMLADDVRLDLVAKVMLKGTNEVGEYYARYAACDRWAYASGVADRRPAMLVYDREVSLETPAHFVALEFAGDKVISIHDFLFAAYALDGVDMVRLPGSCGKS
jgi:RNA polymerase sigma-70 factor (ECF subfamily)